MFGFSMGEIFLLVGGTAALVGTKDLPVIARTMGRLAGRSIGYVQLARGKFENVMQQTQAKQVHKELQDTMALLEAIRHEIRSISFMNPGPMTRRLVDNPDLASANNGDDAPPEVVQDNATLKLVQDQKPPEFASKVFSNGPPTSTATNLHSQATAYERLAQSQLKNDALKGTEDVMKLGAETDQFNIFPVSAESAGLLPSRKVDAKGSDIMLEAVIEAEVAHNAKQFFIQHQDQLKAE